MANVESRVFCLRDANGRQMEVLFYSTGQVFLIGNGTYKAKLTAQDYRSLAASLVGYAERMEREQ